MAWRFDLGSRKPAGAASSVGRNDNSTDFRYTPPPMSRARPVLLVLSGCVQAVSLLAQAQDPFCGTLPGRDQYELALHRFHSDRLRALGAAPSRRATVAQAGEIAVIEADERLLLPANPFDLEGAAVVFEPRTPQGYATSRVESGLELGLGREVSLGTYGFQGVDLPFSFPFYGVPRSRVYVNANGSLTFNFGDGSWRTGATHFLASLPRIAVFFSRLDPAAGGKVLVAEQPDRLLVTWSEIPERDEDRRNTFQVVLEPTGRILMRFGRIETPSGLTGIAFPGAFSGVDMVDLALGGAGSGALFEEFRRERLVDRMATLKRFYEDYPDLYDYVILWTNFDSDMGGALAFESTVRNAVRGIGQSLFNSSASYGSRGQLQSVVMMGNLENYPDGPRARFSRSDRTTLAVVAHEVGHRWLAFVSIMNGDVKSDALLGYSQVHWSFFKDTDASLMYGNESVEESSGQFRTLETWARFSKLDLYLMGFAPPAEVAPFLLVEEGSGQDGRGRPLTAESFPERGIVFRGRRRDVLLDDIIRADGPRDPPFELSQKTFRQAWLMIHTPESPPSAEAVGKVEAARAAFETYIQDLTLGRAFMATTLAP